MASLPWLFVLALSQALHADFQGATHMMPFDEEFIGYSKAKETGPVAALQERIDRGQGQLEFDPVHGYLPALLRELAISTNSQTLVFSKTSFQRERITPGTPRALYFGDDAYIGFIPGSPILEISAVDPKLGAMFYTLDQTPVERPRLVRTDQCLECHASAKSMGVPGHLVRSFNTDENGVVDMISGVSPVNHRTPFAERWGGWYVSGTHGDQPHRGNLIGKAAFARQKEEPNHRGNITNLTQFFDASRYPSGHSDIVALLVLEHQTHFQNFVTRLHYAATIALEQYGHVNYLKSATQAFLKYLLFTEEAPLTAPVHGTTDYATWFALQAPKDSQGRSLRDFDLQTRLFKHPCSYLIYSDAFDNLPDPLKALLYQRLWDILTGKDTSPDFRNLSAESRKAILEILLETKSGLPEYWKLPP